MDSLAAILVACWRMVHFVLSGFVVALDDCYFRGRRGFDWEKETEKSIKNAKWNAGDWAVVTGGAGGLGVSTAAMLLRSGVSVLVACRSEKRGKEAIDSITKEAGLVKAKIDSLQCDLCDLDSVRRFVSTIRSSGRRIKLFVGNAAVLATQYSLTKQGYMEQIGVNFYAHALLMKEFSEMMKTDGGRIIMVGSRTCTDGVVSEIELVNHARDAVPSTYAQRDYNRFKMYGNSKLLVMLYIEHLTSALRPWNLAHPAQNVTFSVVHPGIVRTSIARTMWFSNLPVFSDIHELASFSAQEASGNVVRVCLSEHKGESSPYYHMHKQSEKPLLCSDTAAIAKVAVYVDAAVSKE